MNNKTCGECRNYFKCDSACEHDYACADFKRQGKTVFDRITASPEVLAEEMVFLKAVIYSFNAKDNTNYVEQWISTVCNDVYPSKPEAIAASVAKLKEVEK